MDSLIAGVPVLGVIGMIAGGLVALGIIWKFVLAVVRFLRKIGNFLRDWNGETDRPGVPGHCGVMERLEHVEQHQQRTDERLSSIESQLKPNGGNSFYDKVSKAVEDKS